MHITKIDMAIIHMMKFGHVTTHTLREEIGMRNPHAQMKDLKIQGFPIKIETATSPIADHIAQNSYSLHNYFVDGAKRKKVNRNAITKSDLVLLRLAKGRKITTSDLREEFGMSRPWDHMASIIRHGYPIKTTLVPSDVNSDYMQTQYSWAY